MMSIRVQPLERSVKVDHKCSKKSKNVFNLAFLTGTLRAYAMKSMINMRLSTTAGRDSRHLPLNNLLSSVERSDFCGLRRYPSFVREKEVVVNPYCRRFLMS